MTGNLHAALCALRDETEAGFWWIDSLCINQDDLEERSLQVLRMTSIYRTAFQVVAWIGSETPGQPNLEQYLNSAATLLQSDSQTSPGIGHFYDLLSRKFWRRVWIIQEISVATDVWVVCGSSWVHWDALCRIISLYEELEKERPYNDDTGIHDSNSGSQEPIALQSVTVSSDDDLTRSFEGFKTFRDFRSLVTKQTPIGFLEALKKTSAFLATDDRDQMYALLGLVHDGRSFVAVPDYKVSFDSLKAQMARTFLHTTKNLDFIIAKGHRKVLDSGVPSWTPDWLNPGFEADYAFFKSPERKFAAAGGSTFKPSADRGDPTCICVECLIFEQVDGLSSVYGHLESTEDVQGCLVQPINTHSNSSSDAKRQRFPMLHLNKKSANRQGTIDALFNCLAVGSSLDISWYRRGTRSQLSWLYYGTRSSQDPWYRQIEALFQAKRRFDSLELSMWLEENRDFVIHGQTFESLCKSKTNIRFVPRIWSIRALWATSLFILILAVSIVGVVLCRNEPDYVSFKNAGFASDIGLAIGIIALILVPIVVARRASTDTKNQSYFLKSLDTYMKERHLRLAATGGGAGDDYGWGGLPALVPASARRGDQFAILKGCTTPVLLRTYRDGYHIVGMVYLEGVMRGELMSWRPERWKECKLY